MEADQWGRRIRAFRKLKGFTQQKFARHVGVSVSVLGDIERGNRVPDDVLVADIARSLDVTIEELTPSKHKER
ncbi:helix-turn-helix domain-containing protein [Aureibacillus halotolerans]|uniref:DNA-binding XRE family transcriptional regulator n=1 Tax=Aureibacillus halotolerans TaxID=1508390 RepID=A0A4R6TPU9_9BACI|nr:helix-turn-helix transcriptional regulator [Aureibacillus halotolerans]TDQ34201.1 DNA-binding XRE family transcriptional regulator [Aureibacillus halotolerans]